MLAQPIVIRRKVLAIFQSDAKVYLSSADGEKDMSHENGGYQLGLLTRQKMREHGVEKSQLLNLGLKTGVGILSAISWLMEDTGKKDDYVYYEENKPLNGYHETGPEGPGFYYDGARLTD